jgi:hypothetical protein
MTKMSQMHTVADRIPRICRGRGTARSACNPARPPGPRPGPPLGRGCPSGQPRPARSRRGRAGTRRPLPVTRSDSEFRVSRPLTVTANTEAMIAPAWQWPGPGPGPAGSRAP